MGVNVICEWRMYTLYLDIKCIKHVHKDTDNMCACLLSLCHVTGGCLVCMWSVVLIHIKLNMCEYIRTEWKLNVDDVLLC